MELREREGMRWRGKIGEKREVSGEKTKKERRGEHGGSVRGRRYTHREGARAQRTCILGLRT
jgi:hypothetical protein